MSNGGRERDPDDQEHQPTPAPRLLETGELNEKIPQVGGTVADVGEHRQEEQAQQEVEGKLSW
jgi:hypothetical protein